MLHGLTYLMGPLQTLEGALPRNSSPEGSSATGLDKPNAWRGELISYGPLHQEIHRVLRKQNLDLVSIRKRVGSPEFSITFFCSQRKGWSLLVAVPLTVPALLTDYAVVSGLLDQLANWHKLRS